MTLGNLKIGIRLGLISAILILGTLTISLVAISNMKALSSQTLKLYHHPYAVSTATLRIEGNIVRMHRSMKDVALAKNTAGMEVAAKAVAEYEKKVYKDFDIIAERFLGNQQQVKDTRKLFVDWKVIRDEVIDLMEKGEREAAAAITRGKGANHVKKMNKAVHDFEVFAKGKADGFVNMAVKARDRALYTTYGILALLTVGGALLAWFMARSITTPMKKAVRVADRIADNDLTVSINDTRQDETGQLLGAMQKMISNMSDTIGTVASASDSLSQAASEQASSLEETSSAIEEMTSMTRQNANNADQANKIVSQSQKDMQQASESMTQLTDSMEGISKASEETSKIIKTIDEIAFQTNLLALNAAVEAARAGEAGAGFAVVADEVRNLAMRAADAARDTANLIEGTIKKVQDGSNYVSRTNEAFTEVVSRSTKVGELVAEIAEASREQSEGIEQVSKAIGEMDKVTQQNAANAEEMASTMALFRINGASGAGRHSRPAVASTAQPAMIAGKGELNPEQVIPMNDNDFSDF